jgi:flavin-dependent dehydrogenase
LALAESDSLNNPSDNPENFDVTIVGGALAGSASALLLLRDNPGLKVLIIEKAPAFTRRVGEATVEVSAYFLCRVLGLTQYLNEAHLVKQGMRFYFQNNETADLADSSEIGGRYLARVAAFQVDRSTLDEEVLRRAVAAGATLWRPASVGKIKLEQGAVQEVEVRRGESKTMVRSRWVVDASGVAAMLARQQGWFRPNEEHPTTAVWARWRGVEDLDGRDLAEKFPAFSMACHGIRGTATNHIVGDGWWAWCIPLKGGDVSIGVVFDQRLVDWPDQGGSLGQRLKDFLCKHPVGKALLENAQWLEGDVHWRKNLPYYSTTFAGDGFVIVGDAGGFIDPFYSPGMDWVSYSCTRAADLINIQLKRENLPLAIENFNKDFSRSYYRWFGALYKDKYEYMGDFALMRVAFLLDLGLYYMGVVSQPFRRGARAFMEPSFSTPAATPFYHFMALYNRRLAQMARSRRARGCHGVQNSGRRMLIGGYTISPTSGRLMVQALLGWLFLEVTEGWRSWFSFKRSSPLPVSRTPVPAIPAV